jgi:hypothetical protein
VLETPRLVFWAEKTMYDNNDFGKRLSEEQAEFEDSDIWTDKLEGTPVGQHIDNPGQLLVDAAHDDTGDAVLRPTRAQERQGQRDYDWNRSANLDHPYGMTLAAEERMLGQEQEDARHRQQALDAHHDDDLDRAASSRQQSTVEARQRHRDFQARADLAAGRDPDTDPRDGMDADTLADINKQARRFADRYDGTITAAAASQRLADHVADGKTLTAAVLAVRKALDREAGTLRDVDTLPAEDWVNRYDLEADIQGEVTTLYEPNATNQQQVGIVDDGTATVKVTIWSRSNCSTVLREGDTVRIRAGKVGYYAGQRTLAVTADSHVRVTDDGDGPAPIHGHLTNATFEGGLPNSQRRVAVTADSHASVHEESDGVHPSTALARTRHRQVGTLETRSGEELTETVVARERAPDWWSEQAHVMPVAEAPFATDVDE